MTEGTQIGASVKMTEEELEQVIEKMEREGVPAGVETVVQELLRETQNPPLPPAVPETPGYSVQPQPVQSLYSGHNGFALLETSPYSPEQPVMAAPAPGPVFSSYQQPFGYVYVTGAYSQGQYLPYQPEYFPYMNVPAANFSAPPPAYQPGSLLILPPGLPSNGVLGGDIVYQVPPATPFTTDGRAPGAPAQGTSKKVGRKWKKKSKQNMN